MGEKELTPGYLVFPDGTKVAVAKAPALSPVDYKYDNSEMIGFTPTGFNPTINTPVEGSIKLHHLIINPIALWALFNIPPTNNYLKMHGGVMQRWRQIRKLNERK